MKQTGNRLMALCIEREKEPLMAWSVASLLIHNADVPQSAREALRAASVESPERRGQALAVAARALYRETDLECADVRELVGLPAGCAC
jgi:hypothetical protein